MDGIETPEVNGDSIRNISTPSDASMTATPYGEFDGADPCMLIGLD